MPYPPLTEPQKNFILMFNNTTSILSFLALSLFFGNVWLSSNMHINFSLKLICNLFFADLLYTLCNLLSNVSMNSLFLCGLEGSLRGYSLLSSVLWATTIGWVAFAKTVCNDLGVEKHYKKMLLFNYTIPIIVVIIPFLPLPIKYQWNGTYCYIMGETERITDYAKFGVLLIWVWVGIAITTYYYTRVFMYLKQLQISAFVLEIKKVLIFPVILYIAFLPVTIVDFHLFPDYYFELKIAHVVSLHSLGILNVLAYGYQRIKGNMSNMGSRKDTRQSMMLAKTIPADVHDGAINEVHEPFDISDDSFDVDKSFDSASSLKNTLIEANTLC